MKPNSQLAMGLAGLLALAGCSTPASQEVEDLPSTEAASSTEAKSEKSREYRPDDEPLPFALTPDGVTTIEVPAVVKEPAATYSADPTIPEGEIKASDKPVIGRGGRQGMGVSSDQITEEEERATTPEELEDPPSGLLSSLAPSAAIVFDAADFENNRTLSSGTMFIPPDPIAAAGPNHLVNVANVVIQFFQKNGTRDANMLLRNFFAALTPQTFTFDPKVIYDQHSDRFVVVTLEQTDSPATSRILVAVSDDSDPNGTWYMTAINSMLAYSGDTWWADYPGFSVDEEAIYITANMFNFALTAGGGARLWILAKGDGTGGFYDAGPASVSLFDPYAGAGIATTTQPAHIFGTAPTSPSVGTFLVSYSGLSGGGQEYVQVVRVDNPLSGGPISFTQRFILLGNIESTFFGLTDAPQLGSSTRVEVNDRRALHSVWRDNSLWMTFTISREPGGPSQTTAYWVEVDTSSLNSPSLADQGFISGEDISAGTYTFFPSIAVTSAGDVGIGFSASASAIYPGSFYTTRASGDPVGSHSGSEYLKAGLEHYVRTFGGSRNRWGDYSGIAVDPVDECFWVYNEHALTRGTATGPGDDGRWGTAYGRVCACDQELPLTQFFWHQISLACNPGQLGTVGELFGDDLDGTYGSDWGMFERDVDTNSYIFLSESSPLTVGTGYWIATHLANQKLEVEGVRNPVFEIPLTAGPAGRYNQVGHPLDMEVCWADAMVIDSDDSVKTLAQADPGDACQGPDPLGDGCLMSRIARKWNGNAYDSFDGQTPNMEGTLIPWDGFWVEAFKPGIRLQIPASPGNCGAPERPVDEASPFNGWSMSLIATSGEMRDAGIIGQLSDSQRKYDRHDLPELSPFGDPHLTVVFPRAWWPTNPGDYASDFRAFPGAGDTEYWSFEVRTSEIGEEITLTWDGPRTKLKNAVLFDRETGERIRIRPWNSYTYTADSSSRRFTWVVRN